MTVLAQSYGQGEPVSLTEVGQREGLSPQYLEQICCRLRRAGLVESTRGVKGGYCLARPPGEITLGQVIEALEGPLLPLECINGECDCRRSQCCPTREVWVQLDRLLDRFLGCLSLADLTRGEVSIRLDEQQLILKEE